MSETTKQESIVISEDRKLHYDFASGPTTAKFLNALAEGKILANRVAEGEIVYLPPRAYCEKTFRPANEWVEVGPEGTVEASTVVTQGFSPLYEPPFVIAFVKLDGADTAIANYISMPSADVAEAMQLVQPGARVKAVFNEHRDARVTDFHFELIDN